MSEVTSVAQVYLWGSLIGYVSWDSEAGRALFEYDQKFLHAPIEPSPMKMPKKDQVYSFRDLSKETFKGLPGMLADALPDKFGNFLINTWLSRQGRTLDSFNPIERLCFIGQRGMGALEFKPATYTGRKFDVKIDVDEMVNLASRILTHREKFTTRLDESNDRRKKEALTDLLIIGTSAGGARAKCVIAYNEQTGEVRSGQAKTHKDFSYWLLKLDGVSENKDKELADPKGYGRIEYAYHKMAKACGIEMTECRLLEESGRAHFMTRRFDRFDGGEKLHMQSPCGMAHFDFNAAGQYSYEQALTVIRTVCSHDLKSALEQQFRRAVFNVIGRNQDDHTKNIAFLMDKKGIWSLSPAFDVTYSYNPKGEWTSRHQMSINGKRDDFEINDLVELGVKADLRKDRAVRIIEEIKAAFAKWDDYASSAGVEERFRKEIQKYLRLNID